MAQLAFARQRGGEVVVIACEGFRLGLIPRPRLCEMGRERFAFGREFRALRGEGVGLFPLMHAKMRELQAEGLFRPDDRITFQSDSLQFVSVMVVRLR